MFRTLAAALLFAGAVAPAQVTPYESKQPNEAASDPDKIVCKKVEKIGTRLGAKKVCLTEREWTERAKSDRDETDRIVSGARVCATAGC